MSDIFTPENATIGTLLAAILGHQEWGRRNARKRAILNAEQIEWLRKAAEHKCAVDRSVEVMIRQTHETLERLAPMAMTNRELIQQQVATAQRTVEALERVEEGIKDAIRDIAPMIMKVQDSTAVNQAAILLAMQQLKKNGGGA